MTRVMVAVVAVVFGLGMIRLSGVSTQWVPFVAVIVGFPVVAVLTGQLRKLLLAVILLGISFPLDVYLFYDEELASLSAIGGLCVSATAVALAVLYALWLYDVVVIRRRNKRQPWVVRTALPLTAYVALVAASILAARDRAMATYEVVILVQTLLLFVYLLHAIRGWPDVKFVLSVLITGLVLETAIMLVLPFVGESFWLGFVDARFDPESGRVGGTVGSPNSAGGYLSVMMALTMGVLLSSERGLLRVGALAGLLLGGVAIVLTGSRGGWLGLSAATGVVCIIAWRRRWLPAWVPMAVGMGAVCLTVILQDFLAERLFPENQDAALSRVPLIQLAGRMIQDKPVLGVGANNFAVCADDYWPDRTSGEWLSTVHNKYLLVASENGLLAFTMFVLFLYLTVRYGFQVSRGRDRLLASVALGLTAGVIGQMTHFLVDIFHGRGHVELLWVVAALIAVVHRMDVQCGAEGDEWGAGRFAPHDESMVESGNLAFSASGRDVQWSDRDR